MARRTVGFSVEGPIRGKARIRSHGTQFYKDGKTRRAETGIGWSAKNAMAGRALFEGPIELDIIINVTVPKSWPQKKRDAAHFVTQKPDIDNSAKLIADALNGIVWIDDKQISDLKVRRRYHQKDGAEILVTELDSEWTPRNMRQRG